MDRWSQNNKKITGVVILIAILSLAACLGGLLITGTGKEFEFHSIRGELVKIYGNGLYRYDSVGVVAQGKASDLVTLCFAIPVLLISLLLSLRGSFRARLMLTGTIGYFLYTYMSYTFLWNYNPMFLVYVVLMTSSLIAFILIIASFTPVKLPESFKERLPVKLLAIFQFAIGFFLMMLWLGKIVPTITGEQIPIGLEHYTTLVIQGMDLGFIVPTAFISGYLLLKRNGIGYLMTAVLITKSVSMLTCLSAMVINQIITGVSISPVEVIVFPAFNLISIGCLVVLLMNTKEKKG